MSCPECFSGHEHDGDPKGREITVHGRKTYVAEPADGTPIKGIVIIVPDAFGWQFVNNKILADHYASKGDFKVYLPDFMDGKSAPLYMLDLFPKVMDTSSIWAWIVKPWHVAQVLYGFVPFIITNSFGKSWPKVKSFFTSVRENEGASLPIGAAGFCWGGPHIMYLARDEVQAANGKPLVDAVFTAHPSNLKIPNDIEPVKKPVSIANGDKDFVLKVPQFEETKKILERKEDVKSECVMYPGAGHGFAVRADPKDEKVVEHSVQAEDQAVKWFKQHFANVSY